MDPGPTLSTYCFYRFDYLFIVIVINALGVCIGYKGVYPFSFVLDNTETRSEERAETE